MAFGSGMPPHWFTTAASAKAWALRTVLSLTPFPPTMRTDCLALLSTASGGDHMATDPRKKLARVWNQMVEILGTGLQQLAESDTLVWLPAHQSIASVGERKLSNGTRLTMLDWRANRLVDILAKHAAAVRQPPVAVERILRWAQAAVRHHAMLLGRVTHAANHFEVADTTADGDTVKRIIRDSVDAPRRVRSHKPPNCQPPKPALLAAAVARPVLPWQATSDGSGLTRRRCPHTSAAKAADEANMQRRVQEIGRAIQPAIGHLSAQERTAALQRRVLARIGPAPTASG